MKKFTEIFTSEKRWHQGSAFGTADGKNDYGIHPSGYDYASYCPIGAIFAFEPNDQKRGTLINAIKEELFPMNYLAVPGWNDAKNRKFEEVMTVLRRVEEKHCSLFVTLKALMSE